MALTGKRKAFLNSYLTEARYNATQAVRLAGYRGRNEHSLQQMAVNLMKNQEIREAIDAHFERSRMTRDEVLAELARLAKARNHRDQIKALALLSQHFDLLSGRGATEAIEERAEQLAQAKLDEVAREIEADVARIDKEKDKEWQAIKKMYAHHPEAVEALTLLREVMAGSRTLDQVKPRETSKPLEPEIILPIPQQRRLAAAPVERMLAEVIDVEPEPLPQERCKHGCLMHECRTIEIGNDYCPHHYSLAPKQARSSFRFS